SVFDYGPLCQLIDVLELAAMQPEYDWGGFDASTANLRVWRSQSAEPMQVIDTGSVGPIELRALQSAIDGVASRIRWEEPDSETKPVPDPTSKR
ncbi:MAG: hypothetical protein ACI841_002871, partial [Planctomycetota bacterium]